MGARGLCTPRRSDHPLPPPFTHDAHAHAPLQSFPLNNIRGHLRRTVEGLEHHVGLENRAFAELGCLERKAK